MLSPNPMRTPDRARGPRSGGLQLSVLDGSIDGLLGSPTGSIGAMAGFLGSPLPQIPLFQPSPRRGPGGGPSSALGLGLPADAAPSISGLSNLFASPVAQRGNRGGAGGHDAAALQFASDLLSTPCSRRADAHPPPGDGGDALDALLISPPARRGGAAPGRTPVAANAGAGGRRPARAASLDALLELVGAPPALAAAAAAAVAGAGEGGGAGAADGLLSPAGSGLSHGELELLAFLQTPGAEVCGMRRLMAACRCPGGCKLARARTHKPQRLVCWRARSSLGRLRTICVVHRPPCRRHAPDMQPPCV